MAKGKPKSVVTVADLIGVLERGEPYQPSSQGRAGLLRAYRWLLADGKKHGGSLNAPRLRELVGRVCNEHRKSLWQAMTMTLADFVELARKLDEAAGGHGTTKKAKRKRRRRKADPIPRPLTAKQVETVQTVGECKGNIAEAARRLGKDRKTVAESYEAAMEKLGIQAVKHQTKPLPLDRRGQENLSGEDDRRG